jgi:serine/threonine-protein kinase RsbT
MNNTIDDMDFLLSDPSDNAHVVYSARQMLAQMGFDETRQYLLATAVSELSTNIIRYAKKGEIKLRSCADGERNGFEVIAQDHGPGIVNISNALKENVSTGGGLGLGLPSVKRIMDEFIIQSSPGKGTRIMVRKWID